MKCVVSIIIMGIQEKNMKNSIKLEELPEMKNTEGARKT